LCSADSEASKKWLCLWCKKDTEKADEDIPGIPVNMNKLYGALCDTLYIDRTGSVVRRFEGKQVLLHSAVGLCTRIPKATGVPLFEMLSDSGTSASVEYLIQAYKTEICKLSTFWSPRLVVFDFCLVYAHSTSKAFCNRTLEEYINKKYTHMMDPRKGGQYKGTTLFVCTGHFLHFCSLYMRKKTINVHAVKVTMHAFGSLVECRSKEDYEMLIGNVITLFGSEYLDDNICEGIVQSFTMGLFSDEHEKKIAELNLTIKTEIAMEEIMPDEDTRLHRDKSKFHVYFEERYQEIHTKLDTKYTVDNSAPNPFYDDCIMQTFRRWNVYTPLWSKIAFSGRHAPSETITTGTVEQYFGVTKHSQHPKLNEPEDKFILVHAPYVTVKVDAALRLGYAKKLIRQPYKKRSSKQSFYDYTHGFRPLSTAQLRFLPSRFSGAEWAAAQWSKKSKRVPSMYTKNIKRLLTTQFTVDPKKFRNSTQKPTRSTSGVTKTPQSPRTRRPATLTSRSKKSASATEKQSNPMSFADRDPLDISRWAWSSELEPIAELFEPGPHGGYGTELEILCFDHESMISSFLAETIAYNTIRKHKGEYSEQNKFRLLNTACVVFIEDQKQFTASVNSLPAASSFCHETGTLFMISMYKSHAWLTRFSLQDKEIHIYDSIPGLITESERRQYYHTLLEAVEEKYNVPSAQWEEPEEVLAPGQLTNDCVIISLMCLDALVSDKCPVLTVDPNTAPQMRMELAEELLLGSVNGRKLMEHCEDNIAEVFQLLRSRDSIRSTINSIFKEINKIRAVQRLIEQGKASNQQRSQLPKRVERFSKTLEDFDFIYHMDHICVANSSIGFPPVNVLKQI
jgi:hypothetical protein